MKRSNNFVVRWLPNKNEKEENTEKKGKRKKRRGRKMKPDEA